jgi:type II secretory pathway pseudopilin PulG
MKKIRDSQAGVTLLEMMFSVAILTSVMGVLFTLSLGIGDTARIQEMKARSNDEARRALLAVVPRLRQAQFTSLNTNEMPGDVLSFNMAADIDGNGSAVNISGNLEVGSRVTIQRDIADVNGDGLGAEQLVMIQDDVVTVLANTLSPDGGPAPVAVGAEPAENTAGFWVEEQAGGVLVTIRTQGKSRKGHVIRQQFTELVNPRN